MIPVDPYEDKFKEYVDTCVNCGVEKHLHPIGSEDDIICDSFERTEVPDRFIKMALMIQQDQPALCDLAKLLWELSKDS